LREGVVSAAAHGGRPEREVAGECGMGRTDFFLATAEELRAVVPGWKRPPPLLSRPMSMIVTNLTTRLSKEIRTWVAGELPAADEDAIATADFRGLPWIDQRGLLTPDVVELASIVMRWELDRADSEIHGRLLAGPPHATAAVSEVPPALVGRMARLSARELARHAREWAARSAGEPVAVAGALALRCESWPESERTARLSALATLARRAVADGRDMFLCLSW
jgi:hypothetical protein